MTLYYVNRQIHSNGDHEIHVSTCEHLPAERHRVYLGSFNNCHDALREAQKHYIQANGCARCSKECHSRALR